MSTSLQELDCPNCGAPYALPASGSRTRCNYCGSTVILPSSVLPSSPSQAQAVDDTQDVVRQEKIARWIRIVLILIIVTTIVPPLCSIVLSLCFGLFALLPVALR